MMGLCREVDANCASRPRAPGRGRRPQPSARRLRGAGCDEVARPCMAAARAAGGDVGPVAVRQVARPRSRRWVRWHGGGSRFVGAHASRPCRGERVGSGQWAVGGHPVVRYPLPPQRRHRMTTTAPRCMVLISPAPLQVEQGVTVFPRLMCSLRSRGVEFGVEAAGAGFHHRYSAVARSAFRSALVSVSLSGGPLMRASRGLSRVGVPSPPRGPRG